MWRVRDRCGGEEAGVEGEEAGVEENRQVWRGKRRHGGDETSEKRKETGAEGGKADRLKRTEKSG